MKLFCEKCSNIFVADSGDSAVAACPKCGTEVPIPGEELGAGVAIGDFVIEKRLSAGGMGIVFAARQVSLDRPVALKVLMKEFTNDTEYVESLFREARAAARINHQNIVQAYAVGKEDGYYYLAMELINGDTLKNILRNEGALSPERAAGIVRDIANALDVAWREQKLVHQDIKPDNIMIDGHGVPKLADLGLAKTATQKIEDEDSEEVLGTPQYISPEQITGVPTDVRSDIYSLGATFYHIVTGKLPYRVSDLTELAKMHHAGNLVPPKEIRADLPDELNRIIVKMMKRNIEERYQSAAELSADLSAYLNGSSGKSSSAGVKSPSAVPPRPAAPRPLPPRPAVPRPGVPPQGAAQPAATRPLPPRPGVPPQGAAQPAVPRPAAPGTPAAPTPIAPVPVPAVAVAKSKRGSGVKIALAVLIPLLLIGIGGAGFIFWQKSTDSGNDTATASDDVPQNIAAEQTVAAAPAVPEAPVVVRKPRRQVQLSESTLETFKVMDLSRPEYIRLATELLDWRDANQGAGEEFLARVDKLWSLLCYPETKREMQLFTRVMNVFSAMDEQYRCVDARADFRKKHLELVEQDIAKEAEQKAIDRQRESERQKLQQEIARQTSENQRLLQENEKKMRARADSIKGEIALLTVECVKAMRESAISGDTKVLDQAFANANNFIANQKVFTSDDAKMIRTFKAALPKMAAEQKHMRQVFQKIQQINEKHNIRILFAKGTELLYDVVPGELKYRSGGKVMTLKYDNAIPRTRATLFQIMERRGKIKNAEFYSDVFHGKRPQDKAVPAGVWKSIWPDAKNAFR